MEGYFGAKPIGVEGQGDKAVPILSIAFCVDL
jgi:hypothetical protein